MSALYEVPSIMRRNARYRGHRESEKRLGGHNEQVYDIHKLAHKLREQNKAIHMATNIWINGDVEENEVIHSIVVNKSFLVSAGQSMYHVIEDYDLRKVESIVVRLNGVLVNSSEYTVLHGSVYIDLESVSGPLPALTSLDISMTVQVVPISTTNAGIRSIERKIRNIDERVAEAERKYIIYEDAHQ